MLKPDEQRARVGAVADQASADAYTSAATGL